MALPLEQTIMSEIGLGQHYNWFNGSGSCKYIRHQAADAMAGVIQAHADKGEDIVPPDPSLIAEIKRISRQVDAANQYTLTAVWIAASYTIAAHVNAFADLEAIQRTVEYLQQKYPKPEVAHHFMPFREG